MPMDTLFDEIHNLPNIPKVVQELIDHFNDPDIDADQVSKKVQMDQLISAKVMRLANSARYGAGRKIASIDSAVVMLGFDTLKTLVVASGVTGAFKDIPGFDKTQFWRDSFMIANICKLIAKHTDIDPEVAFTAGMLHNIGEALLYIAKGEKAAKINELVKSGAKRVELQQNQFGYDYAMVGAELARRWNFPEEIQVATRQHADPHSFEEFSPLSGVVFLARQINHMLNAQKSTEEILENIPLETVNALKIDAVDFMEKLMEMAEQDDDIDELLKD